jgi:Alw26I/Eco31I/Esp3I family type II restriction endonuclease
VFTHHPRYLEYQWSIVKHPSYRGMPAAVVNGKVNWQVSSGKSTSFYRSYQERLRWWVNQADTLGVPGTGKQDDRLTIAARMIHPTGIRPCLVCGTDRDVGYYYVNRTLAKRLSILPGGLENSYGMGIGGILPSLERQLGRRELVALLHRLFPERVHFLDQYGPTEEAFRRSRHIHSSFLTPGFMGDPPHRLDGLHDYCFECRQTKDPGRSKLNLAKYFRDRRAFEYWDEGDWFTADTLYASAGPGTCAVCRSPLKRVSPDHVGPLSCGFKQIPLFVPTCRTHNSTKNRRMSLADVRALIDWEARYSDSSASFQVRPYWDAWKGRVTSDDQAEDLSNCLRAIEDVYLHVLGDLLARGRARFLATLLSPQFAYFDVTFEGLDTSNFHFSKIRRVPVRSAQRSHLAARLVRVSFDSLLSYASRGGVTRFALPVASLRKDLLARVGPVSDSCTSPQRDLPWAEAAAPSCSNDQREAKITELLLSDYSLPCDGLVRRALEDGLSELVDRHPPF